MYINKEEIEKRILEELDKIVFYNGKKINEILPLEERLLLVTSINNTLPYSLPDLVNKYYQTIDGYNVFTSKSLYFHLLEEVLELGIELSVPIEDIYAKTISRVSQLFREQGLKKCSSFQDIESKNEKIVGQLSKTSVLLSFLTNTLNISDILYDAILEVDKSLYTKICQSIDEVKETVKICKESNIDVTTKDLGNNKFVIIRNDSNKIVKPVGYKKPTFINLIKK